MCVVCVPVDCGVRVYAVELSSVTGDQGEGGCRRSIPDSGGGVRCSDFGARRIGERLVFTVDNGNIGLGGGKVHEDVCGYVFCSVGVGIETCVGNSGDGAVVLVRFGVLRAVIVDGWGSLVCLLAFTSCQ